MKFGTITSREMEVVLCTFFFVNSTVTLDCQRRLVDPVDADCVFLNSRSYVRNSVRMPALSSKAGVHAHCQARIMFVQILSTKRPTFGRGEHFLNVYGLFLASLWLSKLFSVAAQCLFMRLNRTTVNLCI